MTAIDTPLLPQISLIEASDDYVRIHFRDAPPLVVRTTLKNLLTQLPASDFVRVHRSYVVPLRHIENVHRKTIFIDRREVPLGARYEKDFWERFFTTFPK